MTPAQVTRDQASGTNRHRASLGQIPACARVESILSPSGRPPLGRGFRTQGGGEAGAPFTGQSIRHQGRTKVSVPTSSPSRGTVTTRGSGWWVGGGEGVAYAASLRRKARQLCGGRGRKWGYLRLETGGIPFRGRAPAWPARSSGPRPAAPGPPLRLQHHPAGRGRDVTLHPAPPAAPVPAARP